MKDGTRWLRRRLSAMALSLAGALIVSGDRVDDPLLLVREAVIPDPGMVYGIIRAGRCVISLRVSSLGSEQRRECHRGRERHLGSEHLHLKSPSSCACLPR